MEKYDVLSIERAKLLHPYLRKEAEQIYHEANNKLGKSRLRFAQTLRTFEQQDKLFKQRPKVTNAKAGQSYHNYGLAIDIVLLYDPKGGNNYTAASWDVNKDWDKDGVADWMEVVQVFNKYGWQWGFWSNGKHWDKPHFQKTFGMNWNQLLTLRNKGKVDCEGYVIF